MKISRRRYIEGAGVSALSGLAGCNGVFNDGTDGESPSRNLTHLFLQLEATSGSTQVDARLCARFENEIREMSSEVLQQFIELPGQGSFGETVTEIDLGLSADPEFDPSSVERSDKVSLHGDIIGLECDRPTGTTSTTTSQNQGPFPDGRNFEVEGNSHLVGIQIEGLGTLQGAGSRVTSSPIKISTDLGEPDFVFLYTPDGFIHERSQWLSAAQALIESKTKLDAGNSFEYPEEASSQPRRGIIPGITHNLSGLLAVAQQYAQTKFHLSFPLYLLTQDAAIGPERYQQRVEDATDAVLLETVEEVGKIALPGVKASGSGVYALTAKGSAALTNLTGTVAKSRTQQSSENSTGELYARLIDVWGGISDVMAAEGVKLIDYMVDLEDSEAGSSTERHFNQYLDAVLREYDRIQSISAGYNPNGDIQESISDWTDVVRAQKDYLGNFRAHIENDPEYDFREISNEKRCFTSALYPAAADIHQNLATFQQVTDLAVSNIEPEGITPGGINHPARIRAEGMVEQSAPPNQVYVAYEGTHYRLRGLPAGDSPASQLVFQSMVSDGVVVDLDEDGLPAIRADVEPPIRSTTVPETTTVNDEYASTDGSHLANYVVYAVENGLPTRELWRAESDDYGLVAATLRDDVVYFLRNTGSTSETFQARRASDGGVLWNTELPFEEENISPADASPWTSTTPAVYENTAILDIGGRYAPGYTFVVDLSQQEVVSRSEELGASSLHALNSGVYALYEDGIARISMDGLVEWREAANISTSTQPVETGGAVYAATVDGYLLALSPGGTLQKSTNLLEESRDPASARVSGQLVTQGGREDTAVVVPMAFEDGSGQVVAVGVEGQVNYSLTTEYPVVAVEFVGDLVYIMMADGRDLALSVRNIEQAEVESSTGTE